MKLLSALASIALVVTPCLSTTITLYNVIPSEAPLPSETLTAIGTNSDGATTYSIQLVQSIFVEAHFTPGQIAESPSWSTFTSEPVTVGETMVADASHLSIIYVNPSPDGNHIIEESWDCNLNGKGGGNCSVEAILPGGPFGTSTNHVSGTFTGSAIPIYTLTTTSGATPLMAAKAWGLAALGVIAGGFLVL